jgi:hypothetical protein
MTKNKLVKQEKGIEQITKQSKIIKDYIVKNNLSVKIANKDYVEVEGWQFAGGLLKLYPIITKTEDLSNGDIKWKAEAEIIGEDGTVQGRGIAICSNKEAKKKTFEEYAILSMAQTRAIGKAFRNRIGWIIKLAGYESTPAEEITEKQKEENFNKAERNIDKITNKEALNNILDKLDETKAYKKKDVDKVKSMVLDRIAKLEEKNEN